MVELNVFGYFVLLHLDIINVMLFLRPLVYSFLLTKRNIKGAKKIHMAQTKKDRFTLSYVKEYAIFPKEYRKWHRRYLIYLASLLPQYLVIAVVNIFSVINAIILILSLFAVKFIFAFIVKLQFVSRPITRFDRRSFNKEWKK